jgi:hypothetical protein
MNLGHWAVAGSDRCARVIAVALLAALVPMRGAQATPAQGYRLTLTPLLQHATPWLLLHGREHSDPNTAMAGGMGPSMTTLRHWWLLVDAAGRIRCSLRADEAAPDAMPAMSASLAARLRAGCGALRSAAALRPGAVWAAAPATDAAAASWAPRQVCVRRRCVAAASVQHTLFDKRSQPESAGPVAPAPARCVADRWLIVTNSDDGAGPPAGARFIGVPAALRADIVGHEFTVVDGIAALPAGVRCSP